MRNPTYRLIINLSIADVLALSSLCLYAGMITFFDFSQDDGVERLFGFIVAVGWYANCVLFVLIAFSRWVTLCRNNLVKHIFRLVLNWVYRVRSGAYGRARS